MNNQYTPKRNENNNEAYFDIGNENAMSLRKRSLFSDPSLSFRKKDMPKWELNGNGNNFIFILNYLDYRISNENLQSKGYYKIETKLNSLIYLPENCKLYTFIC